MHTFSPVPDPALRSFEARGYWADRYSKADLRLGPGWESTDYDAEIAPRIVPRRETSFSAALVAGEFLSTYFTDETIRATGDCFSRGRPCSCSQAGQSGRSILGANHPNSLHQRWTGSSAYVLAKCAICMMQTQSFQNGTCRQVDAMHRELVELVAHPGAGSGRELARIR